MTEHKSGIYWLASYPRSGNTWVRMFLRAYMKGHCDINATEDIVEGVHSHLPWQAASAAPIHYLKFTDRMDYYTAALKNSLFLKNGQDIRLKTHDANAEPHGRQTVPKHITKGGVYIVRDPRDVACSYADYKGCTIDEAIEAMNDDTHAIGSGDTYAWSFLGNWSNHVMSWAGDSSPQFVHCVKYEDLQEKPYETFGGIIKGLGLVERGEAAIRKAVQEVEFSKLKQREQKEGFSESEHKGDRFFRKGKIGSWREELTQEQAERIEEDHSEVMNKLGYEVGVKCG